MALHIAPLARFLRSSHRRAENLTKTWERDVSQGFGRRPILNLLASVVIMKILHMLTVLTCSSYSITDSKTSNSKNGNNDSDTPYTDMDGGTPSGHQPIELAALAPDIELQGEPGDGIIVFNLLDDSESSAADKQSDAKYGRKMMCMLSRHGGGVMHIGRAQDLGSTQQDGTWKVLAAVYYPGREFFCKLLRSKWFSDVGQGKKPGKSIAAVTWPFFSTGEPAVCLQKH